MVQTKKQPAHEVTIEMIREAVRALNSPSTEHSDQLVRREYSVGAIQGHLRALGRMDIPEERRLAVVRDLREILDGKNIPRELHQSFRTALEEI